jgi:hypothetical protein
MSEAKQRSGDRYCTVTGEQRTMEAEQEYCGNGGNNTMETGHRYYSKMVRILWKRGKDTVETEQSTAEG